MKRSFKGMVAVSLVAGLAFGSPSWAKDSGQKHGYVKTNLVADDSSFSPATVDPNLVNAWGLGFFQGSPFWIADNGKGVSTLYDGNGTPEPAGSPLVVTIPPVSGPHSSPTGLVANTTEFQFHVPQSTANFAGVPLGAPFLFDTEDGTLAAWDPSVSFTNATTVADKSSSGAVYKGLAIGSNADGAFLYATNFNAGTVDAFKSDFSPASLNGSFTDPSLPAGYAPFGIANINGNLYVTFALQDPAKHDDVSGPGHGFVDIFDTDGNLIQRFASRGKLNSPWGIIMAPANFGRFSSDILIGNFGDGMINAFKINGQFEGQLKDPAGHPIFIDGLWALEFGGALDSAPNILYFTSGPDGESHGLFGSLAAQ